MISNIFILLSSVILSYVSMLPSKSVIEHPLSKKFIMTINKGNHSWKAGKNFPETANLKVIKNLMGAHLKDTYYSILDIALEFEENYIPRGFDARKKWTNCSSLNELREQGACASCWAVSAAATMTDRYCIYSKQTLNFHFSSMNLHSCCINDGCIDGGPISVAWQYWHTFGIVSGGEYGSKSGCQPFLLPPCNFSRGCDHTDVMPFCHHVCTNNYHRFYKNDKKFAKHIYAVNGGEKQIQMEIFKNGPVQAVMAVYEDFLNYRRGVYRYVLGKYLGGHAVKLLGWGVEKGNKFWIAANSWGTSWGDKGFFKIVRGENHCKIESIVMAGEPEFKADIRHNGMHLNFFNRVE